MGSGSASASRRAQQDMLAGKIKFDAPKPKAKEPGRPKGKPQLRLVG
jgi:hypothetical protein